MAYGDWRSGTMHIYAFQPAQYAGHERVLVVVEVPRAASVRLFRMISWVTTKPSRA